MRFLANAEEHRHRARSLRPNDARCDIRPTYSSPNYPRRGIGINVEQQINDYIRGEVDDAMREAGEDFPVDLIVGTIDDIYERSCELLQDAQDQEPGSDDGGVPEAEEEVA
jgi:hypothetical protein